MTELMMALEATKDLTERDLYALIEALESRAMKASNATHAVRESVRMYHLVSGRW